jgi:hypothetical protein
MRVHSATAFGSDPTPLAHEKRAAEQVRPHLHPAIPPLVQFRPDATQRRAVREQRELYRLRSLSVRTSLRHHTNLATCRTMNSPAIAETYHGHARSSAPTWMCLAPCGQDPEKWAVGDRQARPDSDFPGFPGTVGLGGLDDRRHFAECPSDLGDDRAPDKSGSDAGAASFDERKTDLIFDLRDAPRQR